MPSPAGTGRDRSGLEAGLLLPSQHCFPKEPNLQKTIRSGNPGPVGLLSPRSSDLRDKAEEVPWNEHLDSWVSQPPLHGSGRSQFIKVSFICARPRGIMQLARRRLSCKKKAMCFLPKTQIISPRGIKGFYKPAWIRLGWNWLIALLPTPGTSGNNRSPYWLGFLQQVYCTRAHS